MNGFDFRGKNAVITGAGSGIGRSLALELTARGINGLALCDIREHLVEATAEEARAGGAKVSIHVFDIADRTEIEMLPEAVEVFHGGADILINNAGVTLAGRFEACTLDEFEWLLTINLLGVIRMSRAFMPVLRRAKTAQIINISSMLGLIGVPNQAAYCTSKYGVRGFSSALRTELKDSAIGITVVHPGGVATNIMKNARMAQTMPQEEVEKGRAMAEKVLVMPPEKAASIILDAAARRKERVLVGSDAKFAALLERFFPIRTFDRLMALSRLGR